MFRKNRLLPFFEAEGGAGGGAAAGATAGASTGASTGAEGGTGAAATEGQKTPEPQGDNKPMTADEIKKLIQSSTDRATADLGKQIAALKKENADLKKQNMTAEELKKVEDEEREKNLQAKEKELLDRENRLFAIKAIKEIGLDDGSQNSLSLVDFVMADNEKAIEEKVKAFNELVQKMVSARVDEKFKSIGRTPDGATTKSTEGKKEMTIAENLGKARAEQNKKANDVLNMYLGGNK